MYNIYIYCDTMSFGFQSSIHDPFTRDDCFDSSGFSGNITRRQGFNVEMLARWCHRVIYHHFTNGNLPFLLGLLFICY